MAARKKSFPGRQIPKSLSYQEFQALRESLRTEFTEDLTVDEFVSMACDMAYYASNGSMRLNRRGLGATLHGGSRIRGKFRAS